MQILPAIMSGGAGTRLWPVSTSARPKQFHQILSDQPMIVETAARFTASDEDLSFLPPVFVAGESHRDILLEEANAAEIAPTAIILEPMGKNTAAVAAVAALMAMETAPDANVLLLPADHLIRDLGAFHAAIARAAPLVNESIITFGMSPTGPETGFGYIEQGEAIGDGVFRISSFKEKPDAETAQGYLDSGGYTWNSGMFFYSPEVLIQEFEQWQPETLALARESIRRGRRSGIELLLDTETFTRIQSAPIDIAIMEKTRKGAVVPCSIDWADVGSWAEYWRLSDKDGAGNALEGSVLVEDVANSLIRAEDGVHVSVCGVSDVVVIATGDKVMVLPLAEAQRVKQLIPKS